MRARVFRRQLIENMEEMNCQLQFINAHLNLIAEVLQREVDEPTPKFVSQPLDDAMELLARRLWLELPDSSKEDLAA